MTTDATTTSIPPTPPPTPIPPPNALPVRVVRLDISFGNMVALFWKASFAAIPAAIIVFLILHVTVFPVVRFMTGIGQIFGDK
jgi:hypothetical protein